MFFKEVNKSQPIFPKKEKLSESKVRYVNLLNDPNRLPPIPGFCKEKYFSYLHLDRIYPEVPQQYQGVPQGSNHGPLLANLVMKKFLSQVPSISYADDGIFYSNEPFEILEDPLSGIHIHPEKSG